ncbi:hypothetical protein AOLI_G00032360 [Acnodon oligacanthus]
MEACAGGGCVAAAVEQPGRMHTNTPGKAGARPSRALSSPQIARQHAQLAPNKSPSNKRPGRSSSWSPLAFDRHALKFMTISGEVASILFTVLISIFRYQKLHNAAIRVITPIFMDSMKIAIGFRTSSLIIKILMVQQKVADLHHDSEPAAITAHHHHENSVFHRSTIGILAAMAAFQQKKMAPISHSPNTKISKMLIHMQNNLNMFLRS